MKLSDLPAAFRSVRRRNKFGARRTTVDGVTFDSAKEAARWGTLKLLERAGKITDLAVQHKFQLCASGVVIGMYIADFVYVERGLRIIEDVKGGKATQTALWKWKRRHVEAQYGIRIRVVE